MKYSLIHELTESQLIPSVTRLRHYNLRDIADLAFLYFLALEILLKEQPTSNIAKDYADRTVKYNNFNNFMFTSTDLYIFLHILTGNNAEIPRGYLKDFEDNMELAKTMSPDFVSFKKYLRMMSDGLLTDDLARRLLLQIQFDLNIENPHYRSLRILISQWNTIPKQSKKIAITRLLQAFRFRALRSDLLPKLESVAKERNYELSNVNNVETGEKASHPATAPWWVLPAALVGSTVAGYKMMRKRKN